ncbi:MAG TPA: YdeI/OmpD-associated family protein [Aquaticitalea sp.]|nr:YdeI/OmpD-associated family protein [Aquaticitalea sp.]
MAIDPKASEKIDRYIDSLDGSDQKMMKKLREIILSSDPKIVEDWKWGAPNFNVCGMVCWLVAFKEHIGINFFKGSLIKDQFKLFDKTGAEDKNNRIIKFSVEDEIDEDKLKYYLFEAIRLNKDGIKPKPIRKELVEPDFFKKALDSNPEIRQKYDALAYSHKKEYIEWLSSAKREETQQNRLEKALEYIRTGVDRHAKYKNKK